MQSATSIKMVEARPSSCDCIVPRLLEREQARVEREQARAEREQARAEREQVRAEREQVRPAVQARVDRALVRLAVRERVGREPELLPHPRLVTTEQL